jgi:hypothetical protein
LAANKKSEGKRKLCSAGSHCSPLGKPALWQLRGRLAWSLLVRRRWPGLIHDRLATKPYDMRMRLAVVDGLSLRIEPGRETARGQSGYVGDGASGEFSSQGCKSTHHRAVISVRRASIPSQLTQALGAAAKFNECEKVSPLEAYYFRKGLPTIDSINSILGHGTPLLRRRALQIRKVPDTDIPHNTRPGRTPTHTPRQIDPFEEG